MLTPLEKRINDFLSRVVGFLILACIMAGLLWALIWLARQTVVLFQAPLPA